MKRVLFASLLAAGMTTPAFAEPIEGVWKRPSTGTLVKYAARGGKFCGTVQNGEYRGKSIGCLSGTGSNYKGEVVALDEGKTYTGKARINGNTMKLSGCVAGGLICKGENWMRQ